MRNAVSLGGDADTLAAIAGAAAEARFGGLPPHLAGPVVATLRDVVEAFRESYVLPG